jgi:hypothetical protein
MYGAFFRDRKYSQLLLESGMKGHMAFFSSCPGLDKGIIGYEANLALIPKSPIGAAIFLQSFCRVPAKTGF